MMSDHEKAQNDLYYVLEEGGLSSAATEKLLGLADYTNLQQQRIRELESGLDDAIEINNAHVGREEVYLKRIYELKAGLREMLNAEGMVTCDWAAPSNRADLLNRMEELLEPPQDSKAAQRTRELESGLSRLVDWPDGGNLSGSNNMKAFARKLLEQSDD